MPQPRVCVCYDSLSDKYETYLPDDFHLLYKKLLKRNILSFNGKSFDINVVLKNLGRNKHDPLSKKKNHYDLLDLIHNKEGKRYKLDDLSRANLGERKHTDGRKMKDMSTEKLTEACRSDVWQTYRLMAKFLSGEMIYKRHREYNNDKYEEMCAGYVIKPDSPKKIKEIHDYMQYFKQKEKLSYVEEGLINGHKYSEADKIKCLDDLLLEQTGETFLAMFGAEGISLSFDERCEEVLGLLMYLGAQLPYDMLERNLTEGQIADYMSEHGHF
ncbi:ribonuclease H-like domain-containing protein [Acidithiobacillus ferriphilus]|uniref:ribonuclease H-like domain-containing protein n=1 Tax=Acidithiobacillus ferriphilus TaxID=1689834 RepID=UPI0023310124|nr:ribonuclease H-like domain-containing protein [Acidithiobacillus ferriphilus]WCE94930.1 ribonuclease H-like domain-containing protein [Acidithiobacillus ferriphilus]